MILYNRVNKGEIRVKSTKSISDLGQILGQIGGQIWTILR